MNEPSEDYLEKALSAAFSPAEGCPAGTGGSGSVLSRPKGAPSNRVPESVGRYPIQALVGRGGMGLVLRANDTELDRPVAVKILHEHLADDPEMVRRFVTEARVGSGLQHPGVVPVHELGQADDGRPYFTMKLVEGRTLAATLAARSDATEDRLGFLSAFEKICQVLAYSHARGVCHLDLKPANILLGAFGEILVTDWGFVSHPGDDPSAPRARIVGTPAYMSPEQATGDTQRIGPRSDVFALGGVLCEILTGKPPYEGETASEILLAASRAWLADASQRLDASGADPELVDIARRCLSPDPAARPESAGVVADQVGRYLRSLDERARILAVDAAAARARAAAEGRQRRLAIALAAAVVLAVVLAAGGWIWVEHERSARVRDDEHAAVEMSERIRLLSERASQGTEPDPRAWDEAVALAQNAAALVRSRSVAPDIKSRIEDQVAAVERSRLADVDSHRLLEQLRTIRERVGDSRDRLSKDRDYTQLFTRAGIDVDALGVTGAAEKVRVHPLRTWLVRALDDWARSRRALGGPAAETAGTLVEVANRVDPDEFRVKVRAAVATRDGAALDALVESAERAAESDDTQILLALSLNDVGHRARAIAVLDEAQARYAGVYEIHHQLGMLLRDPNAATLTDAIRQFSMALALRPRSAHAHVDLGQAFLQVGDLNSAERHFEEAGDIDPTYAPAVHFEGLVAWKRNDLRRAETLLRQAIALDPEMAMPYAGLVVVLRESGRARDAEETVRKALSTWPDKVDLVAALAEILVADDRVGEALPLLRKMTELAPDAANVWHALAVQLTNVRPTEALTAFREALERDPRSPEILCDLGQALVRAGEFREGCELLRRGHQLGSARGASWKFPSAEWVAEADALAAAADDLREETMDDLLARGMDQLAFLARASWYMGRHVSAARFSVELLGRAPPGMAIPQSFREFAARAAASAGTGGGNERVDPADAAEWRGKALAWLTPIVSAAEAEVGNDGGAKEGAALSRRILEDPGFAGVGDASQRDRLPMAESAAWTDLLARVARLGTRSATRPVTARPETR